MKRLLSLTVIATVGFGGLVAVAAKAVADEVPRGLYVTVAPQRVLDTRLPGNAPLGQGEGRTLDLSGIVPSTATAAVVNLTVASPTAPGYVVLHAADATDVSSSSLNKRPGETRSNSVTVALPASGNAQVDVYNQLGTTQVIVDLFGYYDPTVTGANPGTRRGDAYHPYAEARRVFDSRSGARFGPGSGATIALPAPNADSGIAGVGAVAVNITAVDPSGRGYLTAWDGQTDRSSVSTVNYGYDAATPNFAIVPAVQDSAGRVLFTVANSIGTTDVVIDVFGVYSLDGRGGATYQPVAPLRLADTRVLADRVGARGSTRIIVPGFDGDVPVAANVNVTGVDGTAPTYLTVCSDDVVGPPSVSTLNPSRGQAVPNAAQTLLSAFDAGFRVFNFQGSIDVVADLQGYFVAGSDAAGLAHDVDSTPIGAVVVTRR